VKSIPGSKKETMRLRAEDQRRTYHEQNGKKGDAITKQTIDNFPRKWDQPDLGPQTQYPAAENPVIAKRSRDGRVFHGSEYAGQAKKLQG
jgi:hypothetical protein